MLTYQDYEEAVGQGKQLEFLLQAVRAHQTSDMYKMAQTADLYDHQKNKTINEYVQTIFQLSGLPVEDFTASNAKIASNFFSRLNTQRCTYSLGNGVTFSDHLRKSQGQDGEDVYSDETKERLGPKFDTDLKNIGYYGLIHGLSFGFWNVNRLHLFKLTEFAPLWDETDGSLRAGIRFWQLDAKKPLVLELYEEDGRTKFRTKKDDPSTLELVHEKEAYKSIVKKAPADPEEQVTGEENYGSLPVVPFWGSRLHQSTLVGMQQGIDSYDLIRSGFANDLTDVSQIYWLVENCGGMGPQDLAKARDQLRLLHITSVNSDDGGKITPYSQEIPHQAREIYLSGIRSQIYEDFGGLDVHTVAAGATNDHIDAAYQPLDENADDFEFQVIEFIQQVLALMGIEDSPQFKRNRISNQREQVEMVATEMGMGVLDEETALNKLPNITPDEVAGILARLDKKNNDRYTEEDPEEKPVEEIEEVVV